VDLVGRLARGGSYGMEEAGSRRARRREALVDSNDFERRASGFDYLVWVPRPQGESGPKQSRLPAPLKSFFLRCEKCNFVTNISRGSET